MDKNRVRISKFLSFLLRHSPYDFGLSLDRHGFTDFNHVLEILKKKFPEIEEEGFRPIIDNDKKKRFQLEGGKIRARYGHSVETEPLEECRNVPQVLFHGTSLKSLDSILKRGIEPGERTFVHLSINIEEALRVGRRKDPKPVILKIEAEKAKQRGLKFWKEENIYLTKKVPPQYIKIHE